MSIEMFQATASPTTHGKHESHLKKVVMIQWMQEITGN
jgi:hypothetical protein